jgi:hypothetical protein
MIIRLKPEVDAAKAEAMGVELKSHVIRENGSYEKCSGEIPAFGKRTTCF